MTDVVASGFLYGTLVVPRFVVAELQHIADSRDQARRVRGRRGLEVLSVLQKDPRIAVELTTRTRPTSRRSTPSWLRWRAPTRPAS